MMKKHAFFKKNSLEKVVKSEYTIIKGVDFVMLKRKIEQKLIDWKNAKEHKPLIIKGCRQCGKTFSALEFAKNNYKNVVYLNFFENPDYASVFSGSLEIENIIMMLKHC